MTPRRVYFNGEFVSEQEARVSIFDSALMFGDMVFEMTRTYLQKPFRLRAHLERMYAGLKYLGIDCGLTLEGMERATLQTLELNLPALDGADAQIMHNVSRGTLPMYKSVFGGTLRPTVTISCWPYWWLFTDAAFRGLIALMGFVILDEWKWEDHALAILARKLREG